MVEVDLKIDGKSALEYESHSAPQVGEYLDITHEYVNGVFKVVKVTHRIFEESKRKNVINYLVVEAESINK